MCAVEFDLSVQSGLTAAAGTLNVEDNGSAQKKTQATATSDGDTIEISEEALALFKAKMEEYGAESTSELSDEEKEDLAQTLKQSGLIPELNETAEEDGAAASASGLQVQSLDGASLSAASGAGAGGTSSSEDEDEIEDLEDQIEELQKEIEALVAKALQDPDAKEELKSKRTELAMLEAELAMLEQETQE